MVLNLVLLTNEINLREFVFYIFFLYFNCLPITKMFHFFPFVFHLFFWRLFWRIEEFQKIMVQLNNHIEYTSRWNYNANTESSYSRSLQKILRLKLYLQSKKWTMNEMWRNIDNKAIQVEGEIYWEVDTIAFRFNWTIIRTMRGDFISLKDE